MTTIFFITEAGKLLAKQISQSLKDCHILKLKKDAIKPAFETSKNIIFISAVGIAVRAIAGLIRDKFSDPAVLVIDEKGNNVISLLSGHAGGANALAKTLSQLLNANAVISTASDVQGLPALDLFAFEHDLYIQNPEELPHVMQKLLEYGSLRIYIDSPFSRSKLTLPDEFLPVSDSRYADVIVSYRAKLQSCGCHVKSQLYLRHRCIAVGIGCNSLTSAQEIEAVVKEAFEANNLCTHCIAVIATIDLKANERGLVNFANSLNVDLLSFTASELNEKCKSSGIPVTEDSAVYKATGAFAVAEPSALLASSNTELLFTKYKSGNVTVSASLLSKDYIKQGILYVVGIGPGSPKHITPEVLDAIKRSDYIVGYSTYIGQIKDIISSKTVIQTGMTEEIDRCSKAIELALSGYTVTIVSGGDPGIYGMAGLIYELAKGKRLKIQVLTGITALSACASVVGAPIMHDFASISLSDRLTSWSLIAKRLELASEGDFVIILYNPKSMGRPKHFASAIEIISKYRLPQTPVAIVKSALRPDEKAIITDLANVLKYEDEVDMQSTVIIGNSQSTVIEGKIVTPRGYSVN